MVYDIQYFNCRIKYYDDTHFSVTTYNYRNQMDFSTDEKKQIKLSDLDEWVHTPSLFDKIGDIIRLIGL